MRLYLWFCVCAATLGSFLIGYHTAVIAGASLFIKEQFHLTSTAQGAMVSILLICNLCRSFRAQRKYSRG